jgi:hypothetical protein
VWVFWLILNISLAKRVMRGDMPLLPIIGKRLQARHARWDQRI